MLAAGSNGQVLTLASGIPSWATPTTGTVTSVGGTGTVSGISLSGTVTSTGNLTLGGTLDLSAPPAIGGTTANTIRGTTVTATTSFVGPYLDAASSAGGALRNSGGTSQLQWGSGGGNNLSVDVAININPANAAVAISPTGTGTVTINPATASTMNNVAIGGTTALAGTFTDLRINGTLSLAGSTGTAGYVLTSNGASAPTWQANANGLAITDDTTTNATRYLTYTSATTGSLTGANVASTKLSFNPSTGTLTATTFSGALTGNASGSAATFTSTSQNSQFNSVGVGTAGSGTAGEIRATNNITAYYSDERLKTKIGDIENPIAKVHAIKTMLYHANEIAVSLGYDASVVEVGVTAQSVQAVQPQAVAPAPIDEQYLTVRYERLVPLLIEAIKAIDYKVESLLGNNK
jgi:hypothetical protein